MVWLGLLASIFLGPGSDSSRTTKGFHKLKMTQFKKIFIDNIEEIVVPKRSPGKSMSRLAFRMFLVKTSRIPSNLPFKDQIWFHWDPTKNR